jgi:tetratricopeptide (TPR) repeat protein
MLILHMVPRSLLATICAGTLGLGACGSSSRSLARSEEYLASANYYQAFVEMTDEREANPGDPLIERAYWRARKAWLLESAQEHVFRERELDAIRELQEVLILEPDNAVARRWLDKARAKLARRTVQSGDRELGQGRLDKALMLYSEALGYVPDHPDALRGVALVRETWAKRQAKANDRYLMGVRALAEQLFGQTWYQMGIALENDPALDGARAGKTTAGQRLAEDCYETAKRMEEDGFYSAALQEYLACKESTPGLPELDERIERMQRETKAEALTRRGEILISKDDFAGARKVLEEAWDVSVLERPAISERLLALTERANRAAYDRARDLEFQHRYEAALAAFREIDAQLPEGFLDVKARIADLDARISIASKALARGEEAERGGDLRGAIDAYEEALLVYRDYADLGKRVEDLKKKLAEQTSSGK